MITDLAVAELTIDPVVIPTQRACRICTAAVPTSGRPGRPSTYCSEDCRREGEQRADRARRGPPKNRLDGKCPKCARNPRSVTPSGRIRGWCRPCEAADKAMRRVRDPEWREKANATVRAYRARSGRRPSGGGSDR